MRRLGSTPKQGVNDQRPSDAYTLLRLARPHLSRLSLAVLFAVGAVICWLLIPIFVRRFVDEAIVGGDRSVVWPLGLTMLALGSLQAFIVFLRLRASATTTVVVETDLRSRLVEHLQRLPISFHREWQSGQLLARATSDARAVGGFIGNSLVYLAAHAVTTLGVAIVLVCLNASLAALALGLTVPFAIAAVRFNRRMRSVAASSRQALGGVTSVVEESVGGVQVLHALGREEHVVARLANASQAQRSAGLQGVRLREIHIPILTFGPALIVAAVIGLGGLQVIEGHLTVGTLVAFIQYLTLVLLPLRIAALHLAKAQEAVAAGRRVLEVLDIRPGLVDPPDGRRLPLITGQVRFQGVSFTYPRAATPALSEASFTVEPGETLALVGSTGSGKSTIAGLLLRLADPTAGRILLDGTDIRTVTLSSLRQQLGAVFEEPMLFGASVRDNIAFGSPGADEAQVRWAAQAAGAHSFIADFPKGYATGLREEGLSLSAGQRQRIALARALLSRPRILVLDDPFSNVDLATEEELKQNLQALFRPHTVVLIAHRLTTLTLADRVLFLEGGRVRATGAHEELLRTHPAYRQVLAADLVLASPTAKDVAA